MSEHDQSLSLVGRCCRLCVAVCCSVRCSVCYSVCVAVFCSVLQCVALCGIVKHCVGVCSSVLKCVVAGGMESLESCELGVRSLACFVCAAECCSVFAVCYSVWQNVTANCCVLQ